MDEIVAFNKLNQLSTRISDIKNAITRIRKVTDGGFSFTNATLNSSGDVIMFPRNDGTNILVGNAYVSNYNVGGTNAMAQTFVGNGKSLTSFLIGIQQNGGVSNYDILVEVRSGSPTGAVVGSMTIPRTSIPVSIGNGTTYQFDNPVPTVNGTTYAIVLSSVNSQVGITLVAYGNTNSYASGVAYSCSNYGASPTFTANASNYDAFMTLYFGVDDQLSGTATRSFTIGDYGGLKKVTYTYTATAAQSVTCDVLDDSGNVIVSNVQSGQDVSSLTEYNQHPSFTVRFTLSRNTVNDGTPTLTSWEIQAITPGGVGIDKSSLPIRNRAISNGSISMGLTTSYQTLLSVIGSGYLDYALVSSASITSKLRITVDGVVIFEHTNSNTSSTGNGHGVCSRRVAIQQTGSAYVPSPVPTQAATAAYVAVAPLLEFPYTANATGNDLAVSLFPDSIYFSSSLLIEIGCSQSYSASFGFIYGGGW